MKIQIPFLDLKGVNAELGSEILDAVTRVIENRSYVLGDEVTNFEHEFASYTETNHCIGVGNGLEALRIGLKALGVGSGDEVIVPAHTFIATWLAVSQCGAQPVPVEPTLGTRNINTDAIEQAITPRTRGIIPVHLYGQSADMDPILDIAEARGLFVFEDAAQAQGARYKGRRCGGQGAICAWSFYPGKNLGALGDAGALTTNDERLADRIRKLGNYGSTRKYIHELKGGNSRLDAIQAAVLSVKLAHLDVWNERRTILANRYLKNLADQVDLHLPKVPEWADPVWHLFTVVTKHRDALQAHLEKSGIQTLIHYPVPPHKTAAYCDDMDWGELPVAERIADSILSLPIGPHLKKDHVGLVCDAVREFFERK